MATQPQDKFLLPAELQGQLPAGSYGFNEMYRFAQICQASGLFEDVADAAQAFVKIAKGQEMGLPPTAAMSAFDIIRKRLFVKPWVIAAKINTCGYGTYQVLTQTPEQCTIAFSRKYPGRGWADLPVVSYTFAEAKQQGLTERSAHWKASPGHMLYQRAMGRGGAMYFPELLAGLEPPQDDTPISSEQHRKNIVDLFGVEPEEPAPASAKKVTPSGKAAQQQARTSTPADAQRSDSVNTETGEIDDEQPEMFSEETPEERESRHAADRALATEE